MPYAIDVKNNKIHLAWRRLIVVEIISDPMLQDLESHIYQYAKSNNMNVHDLSARIVEIEKDHIGSHSLTFKSIIKEIRSI